MEFLRNWIINIVTIAVFIILFEIIIPSGKIKKIINLISGFIMIIAIINPVLAISNKDINLIQFHLKDSNFLDVNEIQYNSSILKENQVNQMIEVYRKKITEQIGIVVSGIEGMNVNNVDLIINEDYGSEEFGEVKRIYLYLEVGDEKENSDDIKSSDIKKVEKIVINKKSEYLEEIEDENLDLKNKIKSKLNNLFDISDENVVIEILD